MIGVTAAGGMIDFRYRVVNPEKALAMLQNPETLPVLVAEKSGAELAVASSILFDEKMEAGRDYYILYYNTRGAIMPGDPVSVRIGDLLLRGMTAR